ncbi:MAG TPA: hypothetical protein VFK90_07725 [Anaeromyxobacter sp.]|nr:hypothetical protein [Anaeromyxobacter sp.]
MTSRTSKLVALAAVLAASIPAAALAHDRDDDCDRDGARPPVAYAPPVPQPVYAPAPAYPQYAPMSYWREGGWRARRIHELREELRALDARRAEVYARSGGNPWRMRRFDSWYAFRRAELERRLSDLAYVAWR